MNDQLSAAIEVTRHNLKFKQRLLAAAAALLIFAARPTFAQSSEDLAPLLPALPEVPPTLWEQHGVVLVVLGLGLLALLAIAIWWWLQPKPPVPMPVEIETRGELERLRARAADGTTVSQISRCLRRYFAVAFDLPSGEMTTTEFCRALAGSEQVGDKLAGAVSDFLRETDEMKFSPAGLTSQAGVGQRAGELFERGEERRAELRQVAPPK